ncbi:hypothetical protein A464_4452 [Salmonella bongori N268-08]|uniref:Uncharacterized protein n=1 Tax=Salmonella bongori N268-08 TaxID=1197719 RepID=S5N411_SALBN|nr:hypothetical protein A464_4452 [Salmonella bongori N268-08]
MIDFSVSCKTARLIRNPYDKCDEFRQSIDINNKVKVHL